MINNNTEIIIGDEYGGYGYTTENDAYITTELIKLNMIEHNLECIEIEKIKWSDWIITFNRRLTFLEELGIKQIAQADSITYQLDSKSDKARYALWWD